MPSILDRFFHAGSIAIVGASSDPEKLGGRPLRQCLELGFAGRVYPVNPTASEIQGLPSHASIADLPEGIDCALIALPAKGVEAAVDACAKKGFPLAIVLSSGFAEASEAGREAQARILARAKESGMRLVGPNSMGGIGFENRISATFTAVNMHEGKGWPPLGSISIASQSGFVGSHLMAMFRDRGLGVAKWLATGNQADIDLADCVENFANDDITRTIVVYLEGAGRPDALRRAFDLAREKGKPVVALKAGRTETGARAVASHTASLIGGDEAFAAMCRRHGVLEAAGVDDLVDIAAALDTGRAPRGSGVGVVTVSGGFGILIADAAARNGFDLPEMDAERQRAMRGVYPLATTRNPVDVGSFAPFNAATELVLAEPYGAVVLAIGHFGLMADRMAGFHKSLSGFREARPGTFIALVASLNEHWRRAFQQIGLFVCDDPARAVKAMAAVRWVAEQRVARVDDDPPAAPRMDRATIESGGDERGARNILRAIGAPVVDDELARSADEAAAAANKAGRAVAMKIVSPDIAHKSDIGGVALGVDGGDAARAAFDSIMNNARKAAPGARVEGVMVSPMVAGGVETIVGVKRDPVFGPVVVFGLGGVFVEALGDTVCEIAPFGRRTALEMIKSIRGYPLLAGARGKPAMDIEALADVLARVSAFAHAHGGEIESLEINPLLALPKGAMALDALVVATPR